MTDPLFYKQPTFPSHQEDDDLKEIPSMIGPYKIEGVIAKGGMSILYLGIHPENKHPLAIKVISPHIVKHPEMIQNILKEAHVIALADHPNIVKLYGEGKWEEGIYLAMEFIRGVSLKQFILKQSLSLKRSLELILQVGYALVHLHSHGIIHRDLKPENILITEEGNIKVIDFGIAALFEELGSKETGYSPGLLGTPSYMSPEVKHDPSQASFASDIYSLGVIAYELILGKISFGKIQLELIPQGLRPLIRKALEADLSQRYHDIVDLINDLSNYLKSEAFEKDKTGKDQLQEFLELIYRAESNLSNLEIPEKNELEIAIAKAPVEAHISHYHDFFHLPEDSLLFIAAKGTSSSIEKIFTTAVFKGMVEATIDHALSVSNPFSLQEFMGRLNSLISNTRIAESIHCNCLFLSQKNSQLSFISCGDGRLFYHPSQTKKVEEIHSENPLLGKQVNASFSEANLAFHKEDKLLLHFSQSILSVEERKSLSLLLTQIFESSLTFSCLKQAENAFEHLSKTSFNFLSNFILVLQKIV